MKQTQTSESGLQCSPGWTERCAHAKNTHCTCKCNGENHGKARSDFQTKLKEDGLSLFEDFSKQEFTHHFRGYWHDGGICHVTFLPSVKYGDKAFPTIVVTEREDNRNTSITNMAEYIAAELVVKLGLVGKEVKFVEHYVRGENQRKHGLEMEFDEVTFKFETTPQTTNTYCDYGQTRLTLGTPDWKRIKIPFLKSRKENKF